MRRNVQQILKSASIEGHDKPWQLQNIANTPPAAHVSATSRGDDSVSPFKTIVEGKSSAFIADHSAHYLQASHDRPQLQRSTANGTIPHLFRGTTPAVDFAFLRLACLTSTGGSVLRDRRPAWLCRASHRIHRAAAHHRRPPCCHGGSRLSQCSRSAGAPRLLQAMGVGLRPQQGLGGVLPHGSHLVQWVGEPPRVRLRVAAVICARDTALQVSVLSNKSCILHESLIAKYILTNIYWRSYECRQQFQKCTSEFWHWLGHASTPDAMNIRELSTILLYWAKS